MSHISKMAHAPTFQGSKRRNRRRELEVNRFPDGVKSIFIYCLDDICKITVLSCWPLSIIATASAGTVVLSEK